MLISATPYSPKIQKFYIQFVIFNHISFNIECTLFWNRDRKGLSDQNFSWYCYLSLLPDWLWISGRLNLFWAKSFFNKIILFLTIHPIFQTWTLKIKYCQFAIKSDSSGITDNCSFSRYLRRGHVTILGLKTTMIWAK